MYVHMCCSLHLSYRNPHACPPHQCHRNPYVCPTPVSQEPLCVSHTSFTGTFMCVPHQFHRNAWCPTPVTQESLCVSHTSVTGILMCVPPYTVSQECLVSHTSDTGILMCVPHQCHRNPYDTPMSQEFLCVSPPTPFHRNAWCPTPVSQESLCVPLHQFHRNPSILLLVSSTVQSISMYMYCPIFPFYEDRQ